MILVFSQLISVLNKLLSCEQGNPEQENSKQLVQHLEFTRMSCFGKTDSITSMLSLLLQSTTPVQLAKYCCVRFHVKINDNNNEKSPWHKKNAFHPSVFF